MSRELAGELHDAMSLGASLRRQLDQLAVGCVQDGPSEEEGYINLEQVSKFSMVDAADLAKTPPPFLKPEAEEAEEPASSTKAATATEAEEPAISEEAAEPEDRSNSTQASFVVSPVTAQEEEQDEKKQQDASMNHCSGEGYISQAYGNLHQYMDISSTDGVVSEAMAAAAPRSLRTPLPRSPWGTRVRRSAAAALPGVAVSVNLSVRDLFEMKALKRPPPSLRALMEACCILFGIPPAKQVGTSPRTPKSSQLDYWAPARRHLLSDPFLPAKLRDFDASRLTATQRARVLRCMAEPEFSADRVMKCSKAAAELYSWVRTLAERPGFAPGAGGAASARNRTPQHDIAR